MITLAVDTNSPNQTGFIPDVKSGGTGSVGEYFSQDSSMSLWIRPVVSSTANPLVPWVDDWVSADIYYLSIGAVDDRPTGGTFTLTLTGAIAAQSYNVTAAALTTALSARSVTDGYGALTVTLLSEGVYQVDWSTMIAVPAMTASATLLTPDSQITITQVRAGSGSTYAQQIIDIKQSAVASATISTAYATTDASATQITPPTDEYNSVWVVSFGSVFNGYVILTIRANGVFSAVNVSPFMSASDFGNALALHPEIYYQDPVQPDNISIDLVDGEFSIAFIGTLAGSATVRTISNISVAAAAVVTTSAAHGYVTGDSVVISGTNSTPVIDGTRLVTRLSATTFSVPVTTTVSGSAGSVYNTSQPDVSSDSSFAVFPKGNTGTLNLNTFALAKAFWSTTEDELTYSLQIKRVRASGESKTIFGEDIILKRELIDIGSLITIPTTGLTTLTLGAAGVATGTLNIAGTTSGTVTVTTAAAAGTWTLTLPANDGTANQVLTTDGNGVTSWATNGTGTVSSVSFTGGLISVATATTTPALTVAGTSGGIPYFSSGTTWATSAALAANSLVKGGGAGVAPSTITTGTGVLTALGVNTGSAGAMVLFNGALGTPTSGTLTNCTIPVGGISGLGTGVATFLATPSSANLLAAVTDETGTGSLVFGTSPTFKTSLVVNNPANTFAYTLTPAAIAANRVLNLPLITATDTVAVLGLAQTFTATQTFATVVGTVGSFSSYISASNIQINGANSVSRDSGYLEFNNTGASTDGIKFYTNNGTVQSLRIEQTTGNVTILTSLNAPKTITAGGTTGAQTINKMSGSVNFAAAAASLVVTNSLVNTSSVIQATVGTNDATMKSVQVVAASGSFTIYPNAVPTAETRVNFFVTN